MKYAQLTQLESGWKWNYLLRQHRLGQNITKHADPSRVEQALKELLALEQEMEQIDAWISRHLSPTVSNRLKQTVRAKRKRYFNAEDPSVRKKSIDLTYCVWSRLSQYAKKKKLNLSETIAYLLTRESSGSQGNVI